MAQTTLYERGIAAQESERHDEAIALFQQACDQGDQEACVERGRYLRKGEHEPQDYERAYRLFSAACEAGNAHGCHRWGNMYSNARGRKRDDSRALELFTRGCEGGYAGACSNIGLVYERGRDGITQDYDLARQYYERGCDMGNGVSCSNLALAYREGRGTRVDLSQALTFFDRACDLGNANGCNFAGLLLNANKAPGPDRSGAADFYRRGCEGDNKYACSNLAFMIEKGQTSANPGETVIALFERACDLDNGSACNNAGFRYGRGQGVRRDSLRELDLYRRACDLESKQGCYNLAYETGEGPFGEAFKLRGQSIDASNEGRFDDALALIEQARTLLEDSGETDSWFYSVVLQRHGTALNRVGRDLEAIEPTYRAYEIQREKRGERNRTTLNSLHNYATYLSRVGRTQEAADALLRVYEARRDVLSPYHPDTFAASHTLFHVVLYLVQYDEARANIEAGRAANRRSLGPDHPSTVQFDYQEARLESSLGNYDRAAALANSLIDRTRRGESIGTNPVNPIVVLASIAQQRGRYGQALDLYDRILEFYDRMYSGTHPNILRMMNARSITLNEMGRYAEAEENFRKQLSLARAAYGDNHPRTILALTNIAYTMSLQGRHEERLALHREVLERRTAIFGDNHLQTIYALSAVGEGLMETGAYDQALPILRDVVERRRALQGGDHPLVLSSQSSFADALRKAGKLGEAETIYRETLASSLSLFGPTDPGTISIQGGLARTLREQGNLREAEPLLAQVLASRQTRLGIEHPDVQDDALTLARVQLDRPERAPLAIEAARLALDGARSRREAAGSQMRAAVDEDRQARGERATFAIFADAAWVASDNGRLGEVYRDEVFGALQESMDNPANRAVALSAARRLAERQGDELGALARRREELAEAWQENQSALTDALSDEGKAGETRRLALRRDREEIQSELDAIDARLASEAPQYFSLIRPSALSSEQTFALLDENEAALLIVPSEFGTHVMVASQDGLVWHRSDWDEDTIASATRRLLWDLGADIAPTNEDLDRWGEDLESVHPFSRDTAFQLYQQLIKPVVPALSGKTQLFVAAAGPLSSVPLSVLVTERPDGPIKSPEDLRETPWLADAYALTQLPSLQALQFLRQFRNESKDKDWDRVLGIGDPVLRGQSVRRGGRRERGAGTRAVQLQDLFAPAVQAGQFDKAVDVDLLRRLSRLPGTKAELVAMKEALGGSQSTILLGEEATETAFKNSDLTSVDLLLFATHALVAGEVTGIVEPGLVLTPPASGTPRDDGYLSMSEVTALDLDADWVILSACNTAAGDGSEGAQGLSGLARAFFFAGAHNLLASHWPVRDDVASVLTVRMIEIARENPSLTRSEALQAAMAEIRNDPRADSESDTWAHPNAWAPFTLIGDGAR